MSLRFRKTFTLFPGLRLNIAKKSISVSAGVDGATLNFGKQGVRGTVGLPGSGLSYSKILVPRRAIEEAVGGVVKAPEAQIGTQREAPAPARARRFGGAHSPGQVAPPPVPAEAGLPQEDMIPIASAPIEELTSPSLEGLHDLLRKVEVQRRTVEADLAEARAALKARLSQGGDPGEARSEIARLQDWLAESRIAADFAVPEAAHPLWEALEEAFDRLRRSPGIWDVTAARPHDGTHGAEREVTRQPVGADFATWPLLTFAGQAFRFENANGEEILLFPALAVIPAWDGSFALIDLRDLRIEGEVTPMRDAGGTRVDHGRLTLRSTTGLDEEYLVSDAEAAPGFAAAFAAYQAALAPDAQPPQK